MARPGVDITLPISKKAFRDFLRIEVLGTIRKNPYVFESFLQACAHLYAVLTETRKLKRTIRSQAHSKKQYEDWGLSQEDIWVLLIEEIHPSQFIIGTINDKLKSRNPGTWPDRIQRIKKKLDEKGITNLL